MSRIRVNLNVKVVIEIKTTQLTQNEYNNKYMKSINIIYKKNYRFRPNKLFSSLYLVNNIT